jgi:hypothetical protein
MALTKAEIVESVARKRIYVKAVDELDDKSLFRCLNLQLPFTNTL